MTAEKNSLKKKFINNCIELGVGLLLLGMCYCYIQTHPAEKISFFSGYKVLYQQTEITFQNIFGNNGHLLKQKYDLEAYYKVLITLAEEKTCIDPELLNDIINTYKDLQKEPKKTLSHTLPLYIDKQYIFDEELRKECNEDNTIENNNKSSDDEIVENEK